MQLKEREKKKKTFSQSLAAHYYMRISYMYNNQILILKRYFVWWVNFRLKKG